MHLHTHVARAIRLTVSPETSPGSRQPRTQPLQYIRTRVCVPARVPRVVICALHVRVRGYARTPKRIADFPGRGGREKNPRAGVPFHRAPPLSSPIHIFSFPQFPPYPSSLYDFVNISRWGWGQKFLLGLGSPIGTMLWYGFWL